MVLSSPSYIKELVREYGQYCARDFLAAKACQNYVKVEETNRYAVEGKTPNKKSRIKKEEGTLADLLSSEYGSNDKDNVEDDGECQDDEDGNDDEYIEVNIDGKKHFANKKEIDTSLLREMDGFAYEERDVHSNPLEFWRLKATSYPYLAALARRVLAVPASSSSVERLFSNAGNVITKKRASLTNNHAKQLTLLHLNWKHVPNEIKNNNTHKKVQERSKKRQNNN